MRLKIEAPEIIGKDCKIFLDDMDITNHVKNISLSMGAGKANSAIIEFTKLETSVDVLAIVEKKKKDENDKNN